MPTVTKTYTWDSDEEGFVSVGDKARITTDGSPGAGCFRFQTLNFGTGSSWQAVASTDNTNAGETWEDLGVPVGETVLSIEVTAKVRVVKKTGCYLIRLWVEAFHGTELNSPRTILLNNGDLTTLPFNSWETITASSGIPTARGASDATAAWAINVDFQGLTPVDAEVRFDTLELEITYGAPPDDPPEDPPADEGGDPDPVPGGDGINLCSWRVRNVPAGLLAHLQGDGLTLAYLVKLVRTDGEVLGFTSHDAPLTYDGTLYSPEAGCEITTLRSEAGARVNNLDLQGALHSPFITDTDLRAGLYDGAALTIYLVNWANISDGAILLVRGFWGDVTITDQGWGAEFRSLAQRLQLQVLDSFSPTCRVKALGDSQCAPGGLFADGSTLADYQFERTVSSVTSLREFAFTDAHDSNYFRYGRVIMIDGPNAGIAREIKNHTRQDPEGVLILQEPFPFAITVGETATLEAGCERRLLLDCRNKFSNALNFRGEPYLAGRDKVKRRGNRSN